MDTIEICWLTFFVCAALWSGAKSGDSDIGWMIASVCAGFLALFTAHSVVATVFYWFESLIPSPTSALNPITAGIFTLVICMAFILLLSLAGMEVKNLGSKLFRTKTS